MDAETRDLARSIRTFLDDVVHSQQVDADESRPSVGDVVGAFLGVPAQQVPVVREEVPEHQYVDLDIALTLLAERGGGEEVVGIGGGDQRNHQGSPTSCPGSSAGSAPVPWTG
ncbi:hypothetical protein ACFQ46_10525 [Kineococcus sp. GCM10028916]|uniref:hypothetical protein n=1 Tax=Kineococcus sp. GCM10028916 TaxID=3273394 RepID=UPI00363711C3